MFSPSRSLAPLKYKNYRLLFFAYLVSMLGDGVWLVALPWLAIEIGGGSSDVALVIGAESIGLISCVLIGGSLADRFSRKAVIGWSFVASLIALSLLALTAVTDHLHTWHMVGAALVLGASAAISGPAADAFTPDLVPADDLHAANAIESMIRSLAARMVGPAVGGLLVSLVSSLAIIVINAASFALAAICVAMIDRASSTEKVDDEIENCGPGPHVQDGVSYRQAWLYLRGERWLWLLILWSGAVLLLQSGPRQVLLPLVIHNNLGGTARDYGTLVAVTGIAAVAVSIVLASHRPPRDYPRWMLIAWTAGAAPLALMIVVPSFWMLLPLGALYGGLSTVGNVYWATLLQASVPSVVRGRVISIDWLGSLALVPVSAVLAGVATSPGFVVGLFVLGGTVPIFLTLILLRWGGLPPKQVAARATIVVSTQAATAAEPRPKTVHDRETVG